MFEVQARIIRPWGQPGKMAAEERVHNCAGELHHSNLAAQRFRFPVGAPGQVTDGRAARRSPLSRGPQPLSVDCARKWAFLVRIWVHQT